MARTIRGSYIIGPAVPATVGLVLTAKSIARYPELKSVRFAEYFLIGTLLSVTLGILGGLVLLKAFHGTVALGK